MLAEVFRSFIRFEVHTAQAESAEIDPRNSLQGLLSKAEPNQKFGYRGDLPKNGPLATQLRNLFSRNPDLLERTATSLNDVLLIKIIALLSLNLPPYMDHHTPLDQEQQISWNLLQEFIPQLIQYRGGAAEFIVLVKKFGELPNLLVAQFFPTQSTLNQDERDWIKHSLVNLGRVQTQK
ncbi:MAG: hypothetical protein COY81_01790 [Candidatus Pacebacteria bacterium CG_4_10_14_0_8_um_filter_43_12]|nr:MAG: hypothetical protein COU66_01350 [Candidatus Pacebacteria bacterium CG10_big_fil_rev_8_21_14_0_10_44_11]PIY79585.1 MAG: hypothetical protein COY81_01790 [Candidatus Pacebacteria bacterium CG_4_10_14_0_8_um_filter_43_12]